MLAAAGLLDALGAACNSLSAALEQQQQQQQQVSDPSAFAAVYHLSHSCVGLWNEWPVNVSKSDLGAAASERLCRIDTVKHALLLA
jgi:hypothetical protein